MARKWSVAWCSFAGCVVLGLLQMADHWKDVAENHEIWVATEIIIGGGVGALVGAVAAIAHNKRLKSGE